ncbi:MAG: hypothetical protein QW273_00945 [Candidatus Pacearchaeota archaeon]
MKKELSLFILFFILNVLYVNAEIDENLPQIPFPEENEALTITSESVSSLDISNNSYLEEEADLEENVSSFDIFKTRIALFFAFREEKKAELELKLAKLQLLQAKKYAKKNNTAAMQKAIEAHNRILERVENRIRKIEERNITNKNLTSLERAIKVHELRLEKLKKEISNTSFSSLERINKIIENSKKSLDRLNAIKERKEIKEEIKKEIKGNESQVRERIKERIQEELEKRKESNLNNTRNNLIESRQQERIRERQNLTIEERNNSPSKIQQRERVRG